MSIFRWTAPLLQWAARQRTEDDLRPFADMLRPYVPPGGVFADLGGGTGDIGAALARALEARVVIIDPVREMLARVPADPLVSTRLAAVESLSFPTDYFDGVLCCDSFHHFRDQDRAVHEMARVVRPGGGVLILDAEPTGLYRGVNAVERMLGEPGGMRRREDMEAFMAARGIDGTATLTGGSRYCYLGSVGGRTIRSSP
jgi:SAM-dependent methyltransferase